MFEQVPEKAAVTVSEMAKMVNLSRARFYQLVAAGVFPTPVYRVSDHRPIFTPELQKLCLEVRRRNCGVNGQAVLFYEKHQTKRITNANGKPRTKGQYDEVLDGLRALGLAATSDQVTAAVTQLFPNGPNGMDQGELIRAVFLHIKRRDTGDNAGR